MKIIDFQHVAFQYDGGFALQDVSFQVEKGEIFALLGPNGAGKTTTIRLLNGLLRASSGEICVVGCDPLKDGIVVRGKTGVLTETPALYERLTAMENMQFFGALNGMDPVDLKARIAELLDYFDLTEHADQRVGTYSRGMRQRLAIARALLHRPELLFLDEPTSNLDPEIARQVQDLIMRVKKEEGCSVVVCTHRLHEAEQICDRAAIMHEGKLLAQGTLAELREAAGMKKRVRFSLCNNLAQQVWQRLLAEPFVEEGEKNSVDTFTLVVDDYASVPEAIRWLVQQNIDILSVSPLQPSLEEVYFWLQHQVEA